MLDKISTCLKEIECVELRKDTAGKYYEAVFLQSKIPSIMQTLESSLGKPIPRANFTPLIEKTISEYGGVGDGQTLYFLKQDKEILFAMLWPWQSGQFTTIKLATKTTSV
ncbi:MAG: hypothetical protein KKE64_07780 [Candidatus Omnitrophica bacterium]|nr:hypothetical protein [Candidatus Omnitrophota bacterium]